MDTFNIVNIGIAVVSGEEREKGESFRHLMVSGDVSGGDFWL